MTAEWAMEKAREIIPCDFAETYRVPAFDAAIIDRIAQALEEERERAANIAEDSGFYGAKTIAAAIRGGEE